MSACWGSKISMQVWQSVSGGDGRGLGGESALMSVRLRQGVCN